MNVPELVKQKIWNNKRYAIIAAIFSILPIFGFVILQQFGVSGNLTEFISTFTDSNSYLTSEINSDRLFGENSEITGIYTEAKSTLDQFLIDPTYDTLMKFQ